MLQGLFLFFLFEDGEKSKADSGNYWRWLLWLDDCYSFEAPFKATDTCLNI